MIAVRSIATALGFSMAWMAGGCAITAPGKLTIEQQGSFFVAGRKVQAPGVYDPTLSPAGSDGGQTFWVDQMYVQYQIPANARKLPLILVHGGSGTGRVWETTPDGREGYQTLMLRRGYPVYIVDLDRPGDPGDAFAIGTFRLARGREVTACESDRFIRTRVCVSARPGSATDCAFQRQPGCGNRGN